MQEDKEYVLRMFMHFDFKIFYFIFLNGHLDTICLHLYVVKLSIKTKWLIHMWRWQQTICPFMMNIK